MTLLTVTYSTEKTFGALSYLKTMTWYMPTLSSGFWWARLSLMQEIFKLASGFLTKTLSTAMEKTTLSVVFQSKIIQSRHHSKGMEIKEKVNKRMPSILVKDACSSLKRTNR